MTRSRSSGAMLDLTDPAPSPDPSWELARRSRIRGIIDRGKIEILFQPIMRLEGLEVVGYEALSRFDARPTRGPAWWFAEADKVGVRTELELAAAGTARCS